MNTQPITCSRCGQLNLPTLFNCANCGSALQPRKSGISSKNLIALLLVIAIPVLCCGLCQLGKNDRQSSTVSNTALTTTAPPTTLYSNSSPPNSLVSNSAAHADTTPKALVGQTANSRTATVISENANLRQSPDSNSSVIEELPESTEVQIVKQKSAWFLVKYNGQSGWVHGNTIKLTGSDISDTGSDSSGAAPSYRQAPAARPEPEIEKSNPSGATARCADGSLSFSAHRRGTCSHHGGVAEWF